MRQAVARSAPGSNQRAEGAFELVTNIKSAKALGRSFAPAAIRSSGLWRAPDDGAVSGSAP